MDAYSIPETSRAFVYLGNELVGTVVNGNEARYYINDQLGTTELVTDVNGNILSQIQHTPFGDEVVVQSGTSTGENSVDYFFTGKELDATGLYYFGARYYDPEVGLFISEDPSQDGLNWYEYCRANPLKYVDPDGREPITILLGVYICTVMSAPDFMNDWTMFTLDIATHDWLAAFIDGVGLLFPGLPSPGGKVIREGTELIVGKYKLFNKVVGKLKNGYFEVHHLIEKRFANLLGVKEEEILSIVIDKLSHGKLTDKFRKAIGYANQKMAILTTRNATLQDVWNAVKEAYKGWDEVKDILWDTYFKGKGVIK